MEIRGKSMFTEKIDTKLEFLESGLVNVILTTHFFKGENKIGQDVWMCCLEPNQASLQHIESILSEYHVNIIKTAWTDEVIEAYEASLTSVKGE